MRVKDLTNQTFGRLRVLRSIGKSKHGNLIWLTLCECGKLSEILSGNLVKGLSKSCGCLKLEKTAEIGRASAKHMHSGRPVKGVPCSPTYRSWTAMKVRCSYEKHPAFKNYGGRGIKVCDRWDEFENFLEDMGERPSGRTLDRIENDKDYFKSNCRWATPTQQTANRRPRRLHTASIT